MDLYFYYGSAQDVPNYDCRPYHYTPEDLAERGITSTFLGVTFIAYGVIAELCYVVAMTAMFQRDLRRLSCYKIMIVLGMYDMLAIGVNSLLTGYLWLVGGWYCTHPDLIYVAGAIGLGLWCGACMNCFVLVLNRLVDLWKPHMVQRCFGGYRTFLILLIPFIYSVYFTMFTPTLIFSSDMTAWFFDPFISKTEGEHFYNFPHTANNLLIVVATCVLYSFVVIVLMKKFNQGQGQGDRRKISGNQISIIIQSSTICMANLVAALIYVYMQFFATPKWMILIGHMSWQAGHGIPAFVYLLMNKTIQNELKRLVGKNASVSTVGRDSKYTNSDSRATKVSRVQTVEFPPTYSN